MRCKINYYVIVFMLFSMLPLTDTAYGADVNTIIGELTDSMSMSIADTYKAIPHKQTTYNMLKSSSSLEEQVYFDQFFTLTDLMMSARVSTSTNLYYGRGGMTITGYNTAYELAMEAFDQLDIPYKADIAHKLILTAIKEHHSFLNIWAAATVSEKDEIKKEYNTAPLVKSSNVKLVKAYNILMSNYSTESSHNKKAFFDHLCALDFL